MFKAQAQAQAELLSQPAGAPRTSSPKRRVCCNFATAYFFLFFLRLQAQAHKDPAGPPRGSRKDLFFLFIFRLQAQAQAHSSTAKRHAQFY